MKNLTKIWKRTRGLFRTASQIRGFLAEPLTIEQAMESVKAGVDQREHRFLQKLEWSVYGNPASPYRKLLTIAGCELGDVKTLVRQDGLDSVLAKLAAAGVFVRFDEFKCRIPIVRGGEVFQPQPEDFDDPHMHAECEGRTGGTTGPPVRSRWTFGQTAQMAPHWCIFFAANGCLGAPLLLWRPGHSAVTGTHLACAKFGQRSDGWFISQEMTNPADRIYAHCLRWIGRILAGFPKPIHVPYHGAEQVLSKVRELLDQSKVLSLNTAPSAAVRLSEAAQERGVDLTGLVCMLGSEPLTEARRVAIEASGARATPLYGSTEATWVGGQCPTPTHGDEVHVLRGSYAVLTGDPGEDGDGDEDEAAPLLLTSFAPITPKILLNTDIGDRGVVGRRECSCLYDQLGCHQTIHRIRSSDKITGYGVTFWVSDVCDVLETSIPTLMGGRVGDYQLVEHESEQGVPRYVLLVNPRVMNGDDDRLLQVFFSELSKRKPYYGFMTSIWAKAQAVTVRRQPALATGRGKTLPFHRVRGPHEFQRTDLRRTAAGAS